MGLTKCPLLTVLQIGRLHLIMLHYIFNSSTFSIDRFGICMLQFLMQGKAGPYRSVFQRYQQKAEYFLCSCLGKGTKNVQKTPGGLIFRQRWNNLQFVTGASFLLSVYSDYLSSARSSMQCSAGRVSPTELFSMAKSQVL